MMLANALALGVQRRVGGGVLPGFDFTKESYATWVASLSSTGVTVDDLGTDSGTNTVYGLQYGDSEKPAIVLVGGLHGLHEWRNAYILRQFMAYLANPPAGFATKFQRILSTFQVYCIPVVCPAGYIDNTYANANGVNLNRNFNAFWSAYDDSGDVGTKGTAPLSEPESQIVRDKVLELEPLGFIDFHIMGVGSTAQLEVVDGADEDFWTAVGGNFESSLGLDNYVYLPRPGLPQAQQWVRTVVASNGKKPMTATFEPGELLGNEEQARLSLNLALQFCLAMVDQVENGWPQADAQVVTIQPTTTGKDTQISATAPNGDYGQNFVFSAGNTSGIRRSLLAFALSSVPPGADIQSAVITLNCDSESSSTDYTVSMHRALKEWYEGPNAVGETPGAGVDASTWNSRNHNGSVAWGAPGGLAGTDYQATPTASTLVTATGAVDWDVSDDIQVFSNGSVDNFGWFIINDDEATANSRKIFTSSEQSAVPANRPKVVVTYK